MKDERLGEQVCACIRLKNGQTSSAEEIRAFCKGQVREAHHSHNQSTSVQFVDWNLYFFFSFPLDFSLQDPTLCALFRQLPSDSLWKGMTRLL